MSKLLSVNISPGGIPKLAQERCQVGEAGLAGDGQAHAKHTKPTRAVSLLDEEILAQLRAEGYPVAPGILGENLTTSGLHGKVAVGDRLRFSGGVEIRISDGSMFHRAPGSIGGSSDPSRVFKGTRMGGQMGSARATIKNLKVVQVDAANGVILIRGAVPGPKGGLLLIHGIR